MTFGKADRELLELPHVGAAFVFGGPAGDRSENAAGVILQRGPERLDIDDIRAGARSRLSGYKFPRHIEVLDDADVPTFPTGKADLATLRELFESPRFVSEAG
jgi:acyl-CoA synthetase (AMP-forming)/AMP-acid ligase II